MLYLNFLICLFFLNFSILADNLNNMIFIKEGKYTPLFKSLDKTTDNLIYVESFFMDKYLVTNLDFKNFILNNLKWSNDNISLIFADRGYLSHWDDFNFNKIANYPVVNISWFAANAYCYYLNKRLPYIDEWEYVASFNNNDQSNVNDPKFLQSILDWYLNSQTKELINVEEMQDNGLGIKGLHGFVWEWVQDFNSVILLNTDSEGGGLEEVLYCGATAVNVVNPSDYVAFMRFAFRNSLEANYTMSRLGFRCVKDVKKN